MAGGKDSPFIFSGLSVESINELIGGKVYKLIMCMEAPQKEKWDLEVYIHSLWI